MIITRTLVGLCRLLFRSGDALTDFACGLDTWILNALGSETNYYPRPRPLQAASGVLLPLCCAICGTPALGSLRDGKIHVPARWRMVATYPRPHEIGISCPHVVRCGHCSGTRVIGQMD